MDLQQLNKEQQAAVEELEKNILLLAPAIPWPAVLRILLRKIGHCRRKSSV